MLSGIPPAAAPDAVIVSTRVFQASREELFSAFADPGTLTRWWGPAGFTSSFEEFTFRPGGVWRFTMHAPDGTAIPMVKRFVEVLAPERIVLQHDQGAHTFRMTIRFSEEAAATRLAWHMHFEDAGEAERVRPLVQQANEQNFDRLEALLAQSPG